MSVIANFYLETPILQRALQEVPEMAISIIQQAATMMTPTTMIFWTSGDDFSAFDAGLEADPTVTDPIVLTEVDETKLYNVQLTQRGEDVVTYQIWAKQGAVFMSSERSGDGWLVQIHFPDRESVQQYADFCRDHDLSFNLINLYSTDARGKDTYGLTDLQRETMLTAADLGYYSIPKSISGEEVAAQLGISHQALSERLRRGTETLIHSTIGDLDVPTKSERLGRV
ncbi:helix-turn-helix domain-containing protein [Haladaptatus sp. NG-SE-30]